MSDNSEFLSEIDGFPYRQRVKGVMATPVVHVSTATSALEACALMTERKISSVIVVDSTQRPLGIITERDVLRLVANAKENWLTAKVEEIMSSPVTSINEEDFVHVAMGRLARLKLRHLVVVNKENQAVGMITPRQLVNLRKNVALLLGDEIALAGTASELRLIIERLPILVATLLRNELSGKEITILLSSIQADIIIRANQLAIDSLKEEGLRPPNGPWALASMGALGRKEVILPMERACLIIYKEDSYGYFSELGRRTNAILEATGMGRDFSTALFRGSFSLTAINDRIKNWLHLGEIEELISLANLADLTFLAGDAALIEDIRNDFSPKAARAFRFLHTLARRESPNDLTAMMDSLRVLALYQGVNANSSENRLEELQLPLNKGELQDILNRLIVQSLKLYFNPALNKDREFSKETKSLRQKLANLINLVHETLASF